MTNEAWFHCFAGVAGDMVLGSLVDAGADLGEIRGQLSGLSVRGWTIDSEVTQRNGVRSTRIIVETDEGPHIHRTWASIRNLLDEAELPSRVRSRSIAIFERLAIAEAFVHNTTPEHVHFHEVGALDAIVDVVGTCIALELLDIDVVGSSAIANGTGIVGSAHGRMPNPPPAVTQLLKGVPTYGLDEPTELTTPTGAAIITALSVDFGPMPSFKSLESSGFGAGSRHLQTLPNCVQVLVGQLDDTSQRRADRRGQPVQLLETNVDDATGETIAYALQRLLDVGAYDAWITPMIMKKGRPAHTISALCDVAIAAEIASTMIAETGSFGIRSTMVERWPTTRTMDQITLDDGRTVAIKRGPHRSKLEHDDVARVATERSWPLRDVAAEAESEAGARLGEP